MNNKELIALIILPSCFFILFYFSIFKALIFHFHRSVGMIARGESTVQMGPSCTNGKNERYHNNNIIHKIQIFMMKISLSILLLIIWIIVILVLQQDLNFPSILS